MIEFIEYGNSVRTAYKYDPLTFRLIHLFTTRGLQFPEDCLNPNPCADPPHDCPSPRRFSCGVQNLHYTYDPVGNITHIRDDAQQTIYFRNKRVEPSAEYTYDAIYRLIKATGREHLGQAGKPTAPDAFNDFHTGLHHPGNLCVGEHFLRQVLSPANDVGVAQYPWPASIPALGQLPLQAGRQSPPTRRRSFFRRP